MRLAMAGLAVLGALTGAAIGAPARAEVDPADKDHGDWFGAFWGVELRGGLASRLADPTLQPIGEVGLGLRAATLMSLVDAELGVDTMGMTRTAGRGAGSDDRADHDLRLTSIGLELRLHPLFIRYLQGDTTSLILASIHLSLGGACELLSVSGPFQDDTDVAFGFRFGLGVEVPLTRVNRAPWSLWLGLAWRMTVVGFSDAPGGVRDWDRQVAWLSVSFRWHDIDFARLPHPPELRDRD